MFHCATTGNFVPRTAVILQEHVAEARESNEAPRRPYHEKLLQWRDAAKLRADACLSALPDGTFWEKVDWMEKRYGGNSDPCMDLRNHFAAAAQEGAEEPEEPSASDDEPVDDGVISYPSMDLRNHFAVAAQDEDDEWVDDGIISYRPPNEDPYLTDEDAH